MLREETDAKRKRVTSTNVRIGKLQAEVKALEQSIQDDESACVHKWEKASYNKVLDAFTRTCEGCGKVEKQRNVTFG